MLSKMKINSTIEFFLICGIFLLAFSVRIIYLNQIRTGPLFLPSEATLDEYLYDSWAKEIAFEDPVGKEAFWGLPLYPYFLGLLYLLFGPNVYCARLIQFFIGAVTCCLVYGIGKRVFNRPVGILSAICLAFYNASIFYEGFLVASALSLFLNCLLLLLLLSGIENMTYGKSVSLGIVLGLTALATPSIFIFILFLIAFIFRHVKRFLISVLLCLLVILPVTIRNYLVEKDFIPITAHGGITFYAGNNPLSDGTFKMPLSIGTDVQTIRTNARIQAQRALKMPLKPSQVSGFWFQKGIAFIKNNPGAYIKLVSKKFLLFWNHYEISDIFDMDFFKRFAGFLRFPLITYAVISTGGLLGLFMSLKQKNKKYVLLQLFILSNLISLMIYFVNTRYRLPAVPVLIVFASYGIYRIYRLAAEKRYRIVSYCLAGLALCYLCGSISLVTPSPEVAYTNLGLFYQDRNRYEEAMQEYKQAIELNPRYPLAHNNLAIVYKKLGKTDTAIKEYKAAIALSPDYLSPYYNLGILYLEQGRYGKAIENFKKVLSINPGFAKAREKIALCYKAMGRSE